MLNHTLLQCLGTGDLLPDDGLILANPRSPNPALLRAVYDSRELREQPELPGIYRYACWLPTSRILPSPGRPITYRSQGLAERLGLQNLYITFSGYWPEIGANMLTGTFKECEAYSVCARFPVDSGKVLVVSSAGNTARAFIKVASESGVPLVVVVPERDLGNLWTTAPVRPWVQAAPAGDDCDYFDAISLADLICQVDGFQSEGGAKNVARRDGMGTTVLSAASLIGAIPDFYFQAVGSGTGAIAAYEANLRLIGDGRFGQNLMSLQVAQNIPFLPIYDAWRQGSRQIAPMDPGEARILARRIDASVLANRKPPYGLAGGLFDALQATGGDVTAVTNQEARNAQLLFKDLEGCDIGSEAGVALGALIRKNAAGLIPADARVMLNITGGGLARIRSDFAPQPVRPDLVVASRDFQPDKIRLLFAALHDRLVHLPK